MKRLASFAFVVASIALAACGGGGTVDRGFYGEIVEEPKGASGPNGPAAKRTPAKTTKLHVSFDRPKLVVIRAGWCDICKDVEPSIMAAYEPYRGKIDLVVLDVTDEAAVAKAHGRASDEGVREFFMQYGARTPTVGVFIGEDNGRLVHGQLKDPDVLKRELEFSLSQKRGEPEEPSSDPAKSAPLQPDARGH
ncbi:MAG: thioredoxin family protein [Polyangiaceae bacterium]|nr:thioredoxin family protein [Polyangiaceae bacterium]